MTPVIRPTFAAAARRTRGWLLWLALAVAAAQCFAAWHVYSHGSGVHAERAGKPGHAGPDSCVQCLAAAGIGGAPLAEPSWHIGMPAPADPPMHAGAATGQLAPARPYAIRAPPSHP